MTSFTASIKGFSKKARQNVEFVVRGAAEDTFSLATRRQASAKETGTFREGFVPVDTGHLVGNSAVTVNGAATSQGSPSSASPPDFSLGLAGMEMGDTVTLDFYAEYARAIEYGTSKIAPRYFVRNAVLQWETIVEQNAAQFK